MAKKVIWSIRAQNERKEILEFWHFRTKSKTYSKKLDGIFRRAIAIIQEYPQIGKNTDDPKVKIKIVNDYLLIYEEDQNLIIILSIWDGRRDPKKRIVK